jgi:uncharacterized membrane protein
MNTKQNDVVTEYLHEVDLRLSGLPVLQRRELLADLAAHVATERTERNIQTEGELIEILERLGSPEVVAAAAYEEAGSYSPVPTVRRARRPAWLIPVLAGVVLVVLLFCGVAVIGRSSVDEPAVEVRVPRPAPTAPAPAR